MKKLLTLLLLSSALCGQKTGFVPNEGQWAGTFDFRLQHGYHYVFFKPYEIAFVLHEQPHAHSHNEGNHQMPFGDVVRGHSYKLQWINSQSTAKPQLEAPLQGKLNYLLGRQKSRWQQGVKHYGQVEYEGIYPNINLRYYYQTAGFKYDFIVQPFANPENIKWRYQGLDTLAVQEERLVLKTSVETVVENPPVAYWLSPDGKRNFVECHYKINQGVVSFDLGKYPAKETLIIDPRLIFSTYSGSTVDNWGFTATPSVDQGAYGGGIIVTLASTGYPTTVGAFQDSSKGLIDIGISKFSANGSQLVYSTYFGGSEVDIPFSTLEGPDKSLIILGATGSLDFPVTANAYDTSFAIGPSQTLRQGGGINPVPNGSNIFISILDSTGGNLLGSTYLGDTALDGKNQEMHFNFGDEFRGDLANGSNGSIYFVTNTASPNLAKGTNVMQSTFGGGQDGFAGSFNADLSDLNWGTYLGGSSNDALFSLSLTSNNRLYVTGATESTDLNLATANSYQDTLAGKVDALVAELNPANGALLNFTFTGTAEDDLSYFADVNQNGDVYIFGQTYGSWLISDASVYRDSNSSQFLQWLTPDLSAVRKSTVFGTRQRNRINISPTALLVDDCNNVLLSGFMPNNLGSASRGLPASVSANRSLPLVNPVRAQLYDQDFYFLALDAPWQNLRFATFFGDTASYDHVDGGSSRFTDDGSIVQGVCASCGGSNFFPITDSAYSTINGSTNCNLAVFRFDFEVTEAKALAFIESESPDSACIPYTSLFVDASRNADLVIITYPDGSRDTARSGAIAITDTGYTRINFVAIDTNCNTTDSTFLEFYGVSANVAADFNYDYDSCNAADLVTFSNISEAADTFIWVFGDGDTSRQASPQHSYPPGTYQVKLIATNTFCQKSDTLFKTIKIANRSAQASLQSRYDPCEFEIPALFNALNRGFHLFEWRVNGQLVATGVDSLAITFTETGTQNIQVRLVDTLCSAEIFLEETIEAYLPKTELSLPNVFTPNGDGVNDSFGPLADANWQFLQRYILKVYDRNGRLVFTSTNPADRWDGRVDNELAQVTVFFYLLEYEDICGRSQELKGFTHISM